MTDKTMFICTLPKVSEDNYAFFSGVHRLWYRWKGPDPSPDVVDFMSKNYPPDWTYADFANQFRAELYGKCLWLFSFVY
jgi:hypothetical protein